jgi:AraC-like DNA-binding protein
MEFSLHAPPPALADSVKAIWCAHGTRQEFESPEPIVPDGCVELIFNLGEPFINAETGERQPHDLLAGQMTRPVVALPTGDVDLIGVRFQTGRAGAALRIPMWELQDQLIAGSDVMRGLDRVADRLRGASHGERLQRLSDQLAAQLGATDEGAMANVDYALTMIDASRGTVTMGHIAKRIGISRRHLERQFRDRVGLGAKHVARITRIHAALNLLQQRPPMSGAEIAAACGYSDQAHLIRECQALTGQTPQRLKTTERSLAGLMREAV